MKLLDKLIELKIDIPEPVAPAGNYVPYKIIDNYIYISGQIPIIGSIASGKIITGKVPSEVSIQEAQDAASLCVINTMAILIAAEGNIDCNKINCISLSGFVNSDNSLTEHPEVINGASNMIYNILGENGKHTRIAVGCASLPRNACVEVSSIFYLS